jgi:hypothetical protein
VSLDDEKRLDELVATLEADGPVADPKQSGLLSGAWQLLYTLRANTGVEDTEWLTYLLENGPSPIQRFVIGSVAQVSLVYQTLDPALSRFVNVIDFEEALGGRLNLEAAIDSVGDDGQLNIRLPAAQHAGGRALDRLWLHAAQRLAPTRAHLPRAARGGCVPPQALR